MVSPPLATDERSSARTVPRRVTILGATGSIGTSTLSVLAERPGAFAVEAVVAHGSAERLAEIAIKSGARLAVVADPAALGALRDALAGTGIEVAAGPEAVTEAAVRPVDVVVAAIVGAAGLAPTFAAIRAGTPVALANKECMVSAGDLFVSAAARANVPILPLDSEHNAVFQALGNEPDEAIDKIVLTASGGPFREWTQAAMAEATPEQALRHPNWSMGPKITIDSATMMNKGLEVIEAHHLFRIDSDRIDVLVHPQSIVHGMVAFRDGSVIAQMGLPDMRTPIAHCLDWPERRRDADRRLDLTVIAGLTFAKPDLSRFPALRLAREALDESGAATNILNAANEIGVAAFLEGKIGFLGIASLVEETIERALGSGLSAAPATIDEALELDREGRNIATELVTRRMAV